MAILDTMKEVVDGTLEKVKVHRTKKLLAEIRNMYKQNPVLPKHKREILEKLHEEYDKEIASMEKKQDQEAEPLLQQMARFEAGYKELKRQAEVLGNRHRREHDEITGRYMKVEVDILKDRYVGNGSI